MINFLFTAVQALHNISFETATTFENETNIIEELDSFETNSTFHNLSMNAVGINPQAAESEFNISLTELNDMFEEGKANLSNDEYLNDIRSFTYEAKEILKNQTEDANNVQILNQWVAGMDNLTTDFFDSELCASFLDCMNYAISVLYELYIDSDISTKQDSLDSVSEFENIFLNLTSDFSLPIVDVNALAVELENKLILVESFNMFCLIPPTMMKPLENQTLEVGQILSMVCNATADPKPVFLWYKDDELMQGYDDMELRLSNVTENDTGWYSCTAGNIVANLTFDAAFVNVTDEGLDFNEEGKAKTTPIVTVAGSEQFPLVLVITVSSGGVAVVLAIAAIVIWCFRKRKIRNKRQSGLDKHIREAGGHSDSYGKMVDRNSKMGSYSSNKVAPFQHADRGVSYYSYPNAASYENPEYQRRGVRTTRT